MKRKKSKILISIVILTLIFTCLPIRGEEGIFSSVIRLRVIADSNSDLDQEMKLFVRDALLRKSASTLMPSGLSAKEAFEALDDDSMHALSETAKAAAEEFCRERGITTPSVSVEKTVEHFPTRNYLSLAFPEGEYYSLRVVIGEGEGENWWCVLFPPLCLEASRAPEKTEEEFISVGITPDQYDIISESDTPRYRVRFRIIEWIESIFG